MRGSVLIFLVLAMPAVAQKFTPEEISKWEKQAAQITITRDKWGVPHVSGKTDADAVFGMLYTQCEDDFARVERNYLVATARLAEAEGEDFIYNDLRMRIFMDTTKAIEVFATTPEWLKRLCHAFADGANYYLYKHPEAKPKVLRRFQPWMPLLFSEGSIGGDIESVSLNDIKKFYGKLPGDLKAEVKGGDGLEEDPRGSNGIAIASFKSLSGNAMLLINPHTSFYFRSELHMMSEEGLNAYGAVTWGQFFIYQGFNANCGWMHTSSQADVIDRYLETVSKKGDALFYKYGANQRPLVSKNVRIRYKTSTGFGEKEFTVYNSHHGPIVSQEEDKWVSVKLMQEPVKALSQSYLRTKATGLESFKKSMQFYTNSSNNTVYADDKGNIAYWHGNFMPKRDPKFDWSKPVDGSSPATEWKGLHTLDEIVQSINPDNGWLQNCNSTPFTVAGDKSPDKKKYPSYMAPDFENARGVHAVRVLKGITNIDIDRLIAIANDPFLPGFEMLAPSLLIAFLEESTKADTLMKYKEAVDLIGNWNKSYSTASVPTTLAVYWAQRLRQDVGSRIAPGTDQLSIIQFLTSKTTSAEKLKAFAATIAELNRDFGTWRVAWGDVNRFQRLTGDIEPTFDDSKPSIAVPFTSSFWGSLAAFSSRKYPNTKKMYGSVGNSFVAAVEFGKQVRARSVVTGGSSSNPDSKHFNDQSEMYCKSQFKDVLFYKADYAKGAEKTYHPGEK